MLLMRGLILELGALRVRGYAVKNIIFMHFLFFIPIAMK